MQIQEQRQGAVTVLKPTGPLAGEDAEAFKLRVTHVKQQSMGRFVIDASAIAFIDSLGLEAIADLHDELARSGQSLKFCAANETLREVFDLTEVGSMVEQYADAADAVRSFL